MSLGFEQAGFDVIAAADAEQIHVDTYSKNFPRCSARCLDLSSASGKQIKNEAGIQGRQIDVVFAGPPCQGFSVIGKRRRGDPRNLLLRDLARLIGQLRPAYFVVENVAGILLGETRNDLERFVREAERAGYRVVKPVQILDSAEFGVPQRRRRVFVLGHMRNCPAPRYPDPIFPPDGSGKHGGPKVWDAIGDLPEISSYGYLLETDEYKGTLGTPSAYARLMRGEDRDPEDRSVKRHANGTALSGCLRTAHGARVLQRFRCTEQGTREKVSRFYRLAKDGIAPTLRAGTGPEQGSFMAPRPIHPLENRCITVREAARLHSFPDWFQFHPTKWHGFRQIGNSVPPLLARAVAISIARALGARSQT